MPPGLNHISSLISGLGLWITGIGATGGATMVAYHALSRNFTEDSQMVAHHTSSIRKVLIGTAIVGGAGAIAHFAGGIL